MEFRPKLQPATVGDVADLVKLHLAASRHLTARYGNGHWSAKTTDKGVLFAMRMGTVYVARRRNRLVGTLTLSTRKPWAIDKKYFSPSGRALYLTAMAIDPEDQRQGIGRRCVEAACVIAREWPADAIRLDAWDAEAGAGEFYRKCGFHEVGRASYRNAPLIYFERLL